MYKEVSNMFVCVHLIDSCSLLCFVVFVVFYQQIVELFLLWHIQRITRIKDVSRGFLNFKLAKPY